jgi:hypothetical protein
MIVLRLCGVLDKATAFHNPLTMAKVRRMYAFPTMHNVYRNIMAEARQMGDNELADTIAIVLGDRFSFSHLWAEIHQHLGVMLMRKTPPKLVPWVRWAFGPVVKHYEPPKGVEPGKGVSA